jgi:hypothetical protein
VLVGAGARDDVEREVLHGQERDVDAADLGERGRETVDDLARARVAFGVRHERDRERAAAGDGARGVGPDRRHDVRDGRIGGDAIGDRALPLDEHLEGGVSAHLREALDEAGVLLREEALGRVDREHDGEHDRGERHEQRGAWVGERDVERTRVARGERVHRALGPREQHATWTRGAVLRVRREHVRAHHRGERQRDERRDDDRGRERHGELAEEPAHDALHEEQRDEHRDERGRERDDREADLLRALERGDEGLLPLLDEPRDVLDHHDRVVDDEARRDGERHERQVVERVVTQVHHAERDDERERHRDAGDDRRARRAQEHVHHHDDQDDREHEREAHVLEARLDRLGAVDDDGHVEVARAARREPLELGLGARRDLEDVRAGLPQHVEHDGRSTVDPRAALVVLDTVEHARDLGEADRRTVLVGDHERPELRGALELIVGDERVVEARTVEVARGQVDVGRRDDAPQVLEREPALRERARVGLHAHGRALPTTDRDETDARHLREALRDHGVGAVVDVAQRERGGRDRDREDGRVGRVGLAVRGWRGERRRKERRGRVDRGLHVLLGRVDVAREIELERDLRDAVTAHRAHARERRDLAELPLERCRDRRAHRLRVRTRQLRRDDDRGVVDLRQRRDRQLAVRDEAGERDADHEQRRRDRPTDEGLREVHGPPRPPRSPRGAPLAAGAPAPRSAPGGTTGSPSRRTSASGRRRLCPSLTTSSVSASPSATIASSPTMRSMRTGRTTAW